jgi:hypothetical protein
VYVPNKDWQLGCQCKNSHQAGTVESRVDHNEQGIEPEIPSPELVGEPYKHKILVDFKFSINFIALYYVKGYEGEIDDV